MTGDEGRQPDADWKELASRENNGLAIGLYWSKCSGRLKVDVVDDRLEQAFEFDVDPGHALSAFQHPFAHAPNNRSFGGSLDLQPQN